MYSIYTDRAYQWAAFLYESILILLAELHLGNLDFKHSFPQETAEINSQPVT